MKFDELKKSTKNATNEELIGMYYKILDDLSNDYIPKEDWGHVSLYEKYWKDDRPVLLEHRKMIENELSYRNISI